MNWTPNQVVSCSSVFEQIWSTDLNGWTHIQLVSCSLVFKQIRSTDLNCSIPIQSSMWVCLWCLSRSDPLTSTPIQSSGWIALWCLSRSDLLTSTAQHPCNTVCESLFSVWADQIHWPELLNTHPIQCVSHSPVFEQFRSTHLNCSTPIQSSVWVALQCLSRSLADPLIRTDHPTNPVCESLSSVWADHWQIHWPEWLKHPSRLWVALQCLSRSDPLTWMAKHPSRQWVPLQRLRRSGPLTWMAEHPSR